MRHPQSATRWNTLIGRKRWHWLSTRGETAASLADAKRRVKANLESEFAFAILFSTENTIGSVTGFCYARRLWTGTICLEFLGVSTAPEIAGGGSLLMFLLSKAAGEFGCHEIWGECTKASQGFYLRLGERLHGQPRNKGGDRFSFGSDELKTMRQILAGLQR